MIRVFVAARSGCTKFAASAIAFAVVAAKIEQTAPGHAAAAALVASFDGLGVGFEGPQGTAALRNPSDNSLAVGPDHIVQTVNSRMAIFTKKGKRFDATGGVTVRSTRTTSSRVSAACERATTATPSSATTSSRIAG